MTKKQHYMTYEERLKLEALYQAKIPVAQIAEQLGFCRQTIYNELKRGSYQHDCGWRDEERYSADRGESVTQKRQKNKGRPLKIGHDLAYANYLESSILERRYSPAVALEMARREGYTTKISVNTLYRYIDQGLFLHLGNEHLWEKPWRKKRRKNISRRIAHPELPSISERPDNIDRREESGHWEMDLVVGPAGQSPVILTLTERSQRYEILRKLPDRKAATVRRALKGLRRQGYEFKSITTDNGSEFMEYEKLCQALPGTKIYYCHSYCSWEKGTVENHNRMLRRWLPKGTDLRKVTKAQLQAVEDWMNEYPRKRLGWSSPAQLRNAAGTRCG